MSMPKNQVVMASIGGATLVASLALGYFAYDAWSEKSELEEEIESESSSVRSLLRAEVSPDKASVDEINRNRDVFSGWCEAALSMASSGDRAFSTNVNEAAVKQKIVDDARRMSGLPGGAAGKIVKPGFGFGFPDFVTGDKIPDKAGLGQLQRQWSDVCFLVETLSDCGAVEVTGVKTAQAQKPPEEEAKGQKKPNRKPAKKGAAAERPAYTGERYELEFLAGGAALVRFVNALATSERFVVVDSLDFGRREDKIAMALGGDDKKDAAQGRASSRRARRAAAASAGFGEASDDAKDQKDGGKGVVCSPESEAPFAVKAVVVAYDFGTGEKKAEAAVEQPAKEKEEEK